jgi:hypothetical protein
LGEQQPLLHEPSHELTTMHQQAKHEHAGVSTGWSAEQGRNAARGLWRRLCNAVAAHRRRRVAAVLYAALSGLSDAELDRRGIARVDLARYCAHLALSDDAHDG